MRHKVKKHDALLQEIDPDSAPREYRRILEERDAFEAEITHAVQEMERL